MCKKMLFVVSFVLLMSLASDATATQYWSSARDGLWNDGVTWNDAAGYPVAGDIGYMNVGTKVTVNGTAEACAEIHVGSWSGNSDTVTLDIINGGSLAVSGLAYVGVAAGDVGVININGAMTVGSHLQIGNGGNGTVNMNGGTIDISDHLVVANPWVPAQAGLLNLNAGVVTAVNFAMNDALGVIDIYAGKLKLLGDWTAVLQPCIDNGSIKGYNGAGTVVMGIVGAYTEVTAVPEPATMTILALGGLALLRRRRVR